ncbi:MAG: NUDIX hydrolase [Flavobacteriales bacterium]
MSDSLKFPQESVDFNVALTLSLVIFGFDGVELQVLTVPSSNEPFKGALMLPSKYLGAKDELLLSARRTFENLFGEQKEVTIEQLRAFGGVYRHPMGRVVNVPHYALVKKIGFKDDKWEKLNFKWHPARLIPDLAFDHNEIVEYAKERLKRRVKRRPVGFHLLDEEFTLGQLQNLYESALGKKFDRRNFRKKLFKTTLVIDLDKEADGSKNGQKKGSKLFKFNFDQYKKMKIEGYDFLF